MKLQLDTDNKIIRIEESVNLNELMEVIKKLLPDGQWKEYKIETNSTIIWSNPIVIRDYNPYNPWITKPYVPYNEPYITCGTGSYNFEIK